MSIRSFTFGTQAPRSVVDRVRTYFVGTPSFTRSIFFIGPQYPKKRANLGMKGENKGELIAEASTHYQGLSE